MSKFVCHVIVPVRVASEVIDADLPAEAMQQFLRDSQIVKNLRSVTGTKYIARVDIDTDDFIGGLVDFLGEDGQYLGTIASYSPRDLEAIRPRKRSSKH